MPSRKSPSGDAQTYYEARRTQLLRDKSVTEKKMFGTTALCIQGKVFISRGETISFSSFPRMRWTNS